MDPVFVVLWVTLAVFGGFLVAYIARWDIGASLAVTASFVAIGLGLGSLMGNPWLPTLIAWALTAGMAWACLDWRLHAVIKTQASGVSLRWCHGPGHEWRSGPSASRAETWGERLARWYRPPTERMRQPRHRPWRELPGPPRCASEVAGLVGRTDAAK